MWPALEPHVRLLFLYGLHLLVLLLCHILNKNIFLKIQYAAFARVITPNRWICNFSRTYTLCGFRSYLLAQGKTNFQWDFCYCMHRHMQTTGKEADCTWICEEGPGPGNCQTSFHRHREGLVTTLRMKSPTISIGEALFIATHAWYDSIVEMALGSLRSLSVWMSEIMADM